MLLTASFKGLASAAEEALPALAAKPTERLTCDCQVGRPWEANRFSLFPFAFIPLRSNIGPADQRLRRIVSHMYHCSSAQRSAAYVKAIRNCY